MLRKKSCLPEDTRFDEVTSCGRIKRGRIESEMTSARKDMESVYRDTDLGGTCQCYFQRGTWNLETSLALHPKKAKYFEPKP